MNTITAQTVEVPHLLLCPHAHHLAWVVTRVTMAKAELTSHVAITVLEHKDRGLVDLQCQFSFLPLCVVHIGFLASADAAINAVDVASVGSGGSGEGREGSQGKDMSGSH